MSNELLKRVYELRMSCTFQRHVLARLADRTNNKTGVCWPSVTTLAEEVCCSKRKVQGAIKDLVREGFLRVGKNEGPRGCNLYRLTLPPAQCAPPHVVHPSTPCTRPPQVKTQTPALGAPEPKRKHKETARTNSGSDPDSLLVRAIKEEKSFLLTHVSPTKARTLIAAGLVSEEECRRVRLL